MVNTQEDCLFCQAASELEISIGDLNVNIRSQSRYHKIPTFCCSTNWRVNKCMWPLFILSIPPLQRSLVRRFVERWEMNIHLVHRWDDDGFPWRTGWLLAHFYAESCWWALIHSPSMSIGYHRLWRFLRCWCCVALAIALFRSMNMMSKVKIVRAESCYGWVKWVGHFNSYWRCNDFWLRTRCLHCQVSAIERFYGKRTDRTQHGRCFSMLQLLSNIW